jgi:hypothetical protein
MYIPVIDFCNTCGRKLFLDMPTAVYWMFLDTTFYDQVCQWLGAGQWFSPGTPISSTDKTDRHDIPDILLKVAKIP